MKLLISLLATLFVTEQSPSPRNVADELLAADRAFSAGAKTDLIAGISAMFAPDVAMIAPGTIAYGSQQATDALTSNAANTGATASWTPARVAISRDGHHGFTAGAMTITRKDGSTTPAKYLAYWIKLKDGWRVAAYKRMPAKAAVPEMKVTYLLPQSMMVSMMQPERAESDRASLIDAETSFAAEAQRIGLGPAFKKFGSPDAINLGGPATPGFAWGNEKIAQLVGQNEPATGSSVNWGPEKAIVAASGDFCVTLGYITRNQPGSDPSASSGRSDATPPSPFFTIWKKDARGAWKYIAE